MGTFFVLQMRLRDYGVLDFDAGDARRQPPIDTTWQQVKYSSYWYQSSTHGQWKQSDFATSCSSLTILF